eukprot:m.43551 g.43551  ORF g.43551 m.43551 type:complete len:437 (-) comp10559_c0_seq1:39-1349(-)
MMLLVILLLLCIGGDCVFVVGEGDGSRNQHAGSPDNHHHKQQRHQRMKLHKYQKEGDDEGISLVVTADTIGSHMREGNGLLHKHFDLFLKTFPRKYISDAAEVEKRKRIFTENINRHIQRSGTKESLQQGHTARFGITKFSDMTEEEYSQMLGVGRYLKSAANTNGHGMGLLKNSSTHEGLELSASTCSNISPVDCHVAVPGRTPAHFDWRDDPRTVISPVKNQGQCGGCWAFSAVETVEAAWAIAGHNYLGPLSVQQIISCDVPQSKACAGGLVRFAFDYIQGEVEKGKGVETDANFKFQCINDCSTSTLPKCPITSAPYVKINSSCVCPNMDEHAMTRYIAKFGPLSVKVNAQPWNGYVDGIMRFHCSSLNTSGDHAVQIVGYGSQSVNGVPTPYWIVRNSWGADWGEKGYIRIYRGENVCGIANNVNFAFSSP